MPIQWGPQGQQQKPQSPWAAPSPGQEGYGLPKSPIFQSKVGVLEPEQYSDANLGTGITAATNANAGGIMALQKAASGPNQLDVNSQNAMRQVLMQRLGSLEGGTNAQKGELDTQLQRGAQNQADVLRRSMAGGGAYGSGNFSRAIGDIGGHTANARAQGLLGIENNTNAQLGQIGAGLQSVGQQGLQQGAFQNQQANQYAQLLQQIANQQLGRDTSIAGNELAKQKMTMDMWGQIIGGATGIGAAAAGKPPGA